MSTAAKEENVGPENLAAYANALFEEAVAGPRDQLGESLFRMSLMAWENPQLRSRLLADMRSAITTDAGAAQLRDHFSSMLVVRLGEVVKVPTVNLNAVVAQVVGVIMLRYVMKMEPIASVSENELVDTFAPTIQRYLDA